MKNVVISKIARYIFTESQLKSYWEKQNRPFEFKDLNLEQYMDLAKKMLENASHSQLEHHILTRGWRTKEEMEGKSIEENHSNPQCHLEVIDTEQQAENPTFIIIDRMIELECETCDFSFYVTEVNEQVKNLCCPKDGGKVKASSIHLIQKNKK